MLCTSLKPPFSIKEKRRDSAGEKVEKKEREPHVTH